jgi:hypothetical protein
MIKSLSFAFALIVLLPAASAYEGKSVERVEG